MCNDRFEDIQLCYQSYNTNDRIFKHLYCLCTYKQDILLRTRDEDKRKADVTGQIKMIKQQQCKISMCDENGKKRQ